MTAQGSNYTSPVIQIIGDGYGAAAVVPRGGLVAGKITKIKVISAGVGYSTPPTVVITDGGPGVGATASTTLLTNKGKVTSVTITNFGQDYITAPSISFVGGGGSGAVAFVTLNPKG